MGCSERKKDAGHMARNLIMDSIRDRVMFVDNYNMKSN